MALGPTKRRKYRYLVTTKIEDAIIFSIKIDFE